MTLPAWFDAGPDWDWRTWMAGLPQDPATLRELARFDPLLFALRYLRSHLTAPETGGIVTLSEVHIEWCRLALDWTLQHDRPQADRRAEIAPRGMGKSTWHFLILPMWAAAYGHRRFCLAVADSTAQAETHLRTFKHELDTNPLLRRDFLPLCTPARRPSGAQVADRAGMLHTSVGFVFAARGIDAANLGLKVGEARPDLLVLDDIEPDESSYSALQAEKRLTTVRDAIFQLNIYASVVIVGTVTMPGSIVHQLVKVAKGETGEADELDWIREENIEPHHYDPLPQDETGAERSVWPEKWPIEWLQGQRHTRTYKKNYANDPAGVSAGYWTSEDFRYVDEVGPEYTRWHLQLDPAVTTKRTSDRTGWAVIAYAPAATVGDLQHVRTERGGAGRAVVVAAGGVRLIGESRRQHVLSLLARYPRIRAVRIETNQGGDMYRHELHDLGVKLLTHSETAPKEIRMGWGVQLYQEAGGRVEHMRDAVRPAEEEMLGFPRAAHDDVADAVVSGLLYHMSGMIQTRSKTNMRGRPVAVGVSSTSYV